MAQTIHKRELTSIDQRIIGQLLVETLSGEISKEIRQAVNALGDPREIPQPYTDLVALTDGFVATTTSNSQTSSYESSTSS